MKGDTHIFTGIIDSNCKGIMNISDIDMNSSFEYDEKEYTIFWKDPQTREKWVKGKNFYNLGFF